MLIQVSYVERFGGAQIKHTFYVKQGKEINELGNGFSSGKGGSKWPIFCNE